MKLLYNARIHTLDDVDPYATALVIDNGIILAVGGEELLSEVDPANCENMGGQVILPGLIDAHIHLQEYALSLGFVNCEIDSKKEILSRVGERVKETPHGQWVRGHGWNQNSWGGEFPNASDLDSVAPENPIYITAKSLHAAWINHAAMKLAGIGPNTPDPINGRIQRDVGGTPTGILFEEAVKLAESVIPEPTPEALAKKIKEIIASLWRMGLTGVHDFDKSTCFQALQILNERKELDFRVVKSIPFEFLANAASLGLRSGFGDDQLRIGAVKYFADGALGPHTGAMFEAYVDEPKNRGILIMDGEQVFEQGCLAATSGISMAVHAIGDRAIHEVLNGFARLRTYEHEHSLPMLRHRIEHVQTINPADAGRLGELNIIASMQPAHAPSDMIMADRFLGKRAQLSYAWKTQLTHNALLAFGSDAPVESPNPFLGLYSATTRCRPDGSPGPQGWIPGERLTMGESLKAYTFGPAYCAGMENRQGRLAAGFLADLIVLENDPFECEPAELIQIQPTATMVGGKWVVQL